MSFTARRDRWGAQAEVDLTDTSNDGQCVYAEVTLVVKGGPDGHQRLGEVCGKGQSINVTSRVTPPPTPPSVGHAITHIEVKVCKSPLVDLPLLPELRQCFKVKTELPQHVGIEGADLVALDSFMGLPLDDFLALKEFRPEPYDWNDDGCSAPAPLFAWSELFHTACVRHDFGYRNYGKGWMDPTDQRRQWIDERFRQDLIGICDQTSVPGCGRFAQIFYRGVHDFGGPAFFGEG